MVLIRRLQEKILQIHWLHFISSYDAGIFWIDRRSKAYQRSGGLDIANSFVTKDIDPVNFYFTSTIGELISDYVSNDIPQHLNIRNIDFRTGNNYLIKKFFDFLKVVMLRNLLLNSFTGCNVAKANLC